MLFVTMWWGLLGLSEMVMVGGGVFGWFGMVVVRFLFGGLGCVRDFEFVLGRLRCGS